MVRPPPLLSHPRDVRKLQNQDQMWSSQSNQQTKRGIHRSHSRSCHYYHSARNAMGIRSMVDRSSTHNHSTRTSVPQHRPVYHRPPHMDPPSQFATQSRATNPLNATRLQLQKVRHSSYAAQGLPPLQERPASIPRIKNAGPERARTETYRHKVQDIFGDSRIQDPTHHQLKPLLAPIISNSAKETEGREHTKWVHSLPDVTILRYTDRSKTEEGTTSSTWDCVVRENMESRLPFEGQCQIGNKADNEDGETHAIQEGLYNIRRRFQEPMSIFVCVDNQNAVRSLSGGTTNRRE